MRFFSGVERVLGVRVMAALFRLVGLRVLWRLGRPSGERRVERWRVRFCALVCAYSEGDEGFFVLVALKRATLAACC